MSTASTVNTQPRRKKSSFRQPPPSPIEIAYWKAAQPVIPELEREVWIGPYRVDFLIRSQRTVIELYGFKWHSSKDKLAKDAGRERYLQQQGYHVIRFMEREVAQNPERCVQETLACVRGLTGHSVTETPRRATIFEPEAAYTTVVAQRLAEQTGNIIPAAPRPHGATRPPRRPARNRLGLTVQQTWAVMGVLAFDVIILGAAVMMLVQ